MIHHCQFDIYFTCTLLLNLRCQISCSVWVTGRPLTLGYLLFPPLGHFIWFLQLKCHLSCHRERNCAPNRPSLLLIGLRNRKYGTKTPPPSVGPLRFNLMWPNENHENKTFILKIFYPSLVWFLCNVHITCRTSH